MESKPFLTRFFGHLHTINRHKRIVRHLCFKCGLYKQGLLHDLSKYSPVEFWSGVKYWQGYRSPISYERELNGYSPGWLHHAGRNRHHWEYWIDKDYKNIKFVVLKMPLNYMLESTLDRIAASKNYNPDTYNDSFPLDFFEKGKDKLFMDEANIKSYRHLLGYLKDNGEEKALAYYKELYKKWKKDHSFNI